MFQQTALKTGTEAGVYASLKVIKGVNLLLCPFVLHFTRLCAKAVFINCVQSFLLLSVWSLIWTVRHYIPLIWLTNAICIHYTFTPYLKSACREQIRFWAASKKWKDLIMQFLTRHMQCLGFLDSTAGWSHLTLLHKDWVLCLTMPLLAKLWFIRKVFLLFYDQAFVENKFSAKKLFSKETAANNLNQTAIKPHKVVLWQQGLTIVFKVLTSYAWHNSFCEHQKNFIGKILYIYILYVF